MPLLQETTNLTWDHYKSHVGSKEERYHGGDSTKQVP